MGQYITLALLIVHLLSINNAERNKISGWLLAYDEIPTIHQLDYAIANGNAQPGHAVYLATADCKRVGEVGLIKIEDSHWMDYQVFDCAGADGTAAWMEENNIIAEVDYYTWRDYGLGRATMIPGGKLSKAEDKPTIPKLPIHPSFPIQLRTCEDSVLQACLQACTKCLERCCDSKQPTSHRSPTYQD
jgi:hypothetical protein